MLEIANNVDLSISGFEMGEIDVFLGGAIDEEDALPIVNDLDPPLTKLGDLWRLGDHRLLCADALKAESYERLMGQERAQMIFTDPPWNIAIEDNVSGLGAVKHKDFAMACGEMSPMEFEAFLRASLGHAAAHSEDGALHYVCMHWSKMKEMLAAADPVYGDLVNLCVWNKTNAGMGSLYRSKHELIFVYRNGKGGHVNNVGARPVRPPPQQRLGLSWAKHLQWDGQEQAQAASDRQASGAGRRRRPGRVAPGRGYSGSVRRRRFNADCGREDRPQSPTDRTRAALRRRDDHAMGGADGTPRRTEVGWRRNLCWREFNLALTSQPHRWWRRDRSAKATPFAAPARRRHMTDASGADKTVGYRRPPLHTRFRPGVSGNPRGRQKGVRNFAADVKRTLEIPVTLTENGKSKRVSTQEALILRLREKALKGDARALETLLSLARTHNEDFASQTEDRSLAAEDQAILDAYLEDALARRSQSHGSVPATDPGDRNGEEEGQ